jgi:hypothetical protein
MPTLLKLINNLKNKFLEKEKEMIVWEKEDLKKSRSVEYKEKYINYIDKFYMNQVTENNFTDKNIINLENKIKNSIPTGYKCKASIECDCECRCRCNSINLKVKFSDKYLKKRDRLCKSEGKNKEMKTFIKEEIEFYKKLEKKDNNKKLEIPLPCDTYVRFDKKGMKFNGIKPPLSESILMLYFSKLFKVEYEVLKKCFKNIEKAIENIEKFK